MQSGGRLSSGCWSLLSDHDPVGDKTWQTVLKKDVKFKHLSGDDAPAIKTSARDLLSVHFMDYYVFYAIIPDFDW